MTLCSTMRKNKLEKSENPRFYGQNKLLLKHLVLQPLGSFSHMVACRSSSKNTRRMNLKLFLNKKFTMGSYGVGIGCAWCCQKACEIFSLLVQKTNRKKIKNLLTGCPIANNRFLV